jgi:hypothetical protein
MNTFFAEYRQNRWVVTEYLGLTTMHIRFYQVPDQSQRGATAVCDALVRAERGYNVAHTWGGKRNDPSSV